MQDDELMTKWDLYVPHGTEPVRAVATARLLEAQERHFEALNEATVEALRAVCGVGWQDLLLMGLGAAFARHPLHDLVAVHPASGPLHLLPRLVGTVGDGMDWSWKIETESIALDEARPLPARLSNLPAPELWGHLHAPIAEFVFEEALNQVMHAILAHALAQSDTKKCWCPTGAVSEGVLGAQRLVAKASGRTPNVLVLNHGHAKPPTGHLRTVHLPHFPGDKLLLLHKGLSPLFGSIAWVPYVFEVLVPEQPETDPETFEQYPGGLALAIRHHVAIAEPDSLVTITMRAPTPAAPAPEQPPEPEQPEQPVPDSPAPESE